MIALKIKLPFILFFNNFIYLFILAALDLPCCADFSLVAVSRRLLFVVFRGLLLVVASLVVEHRL